MLPLLGSNKPIALQSGKPFQEIVLAVEKIEVLNSFEVANLTAASDKILLSQMNFCHCLTGRFTGLLFPLVL